jgi:hypothetical protein
MKQDVIDSRRYIKVEIIKNGQKVGCEEETSSWIGKYNKKIGGKQEVKNER